MKQVGTFVLLFVVFFAACVLLSVAVIGAQWVIVDAFFDTDHDLAMRDLNIEMLRMDGIEVETGATCSRVQEAYDKHMAESREKRKAHERPFVACTRPAKKGT
jgi:hypothetical protein